MPISYRPFPFLLFMFFYKTCNSIHCSDSFSWYLKAYVHLIIFFELMQPAVHLLVL